MAQRKAEKEGVALPMRHLGAIQSRERDHRGTETHRDSLRKAEEEEMESRNPPVTRRNRAKSCREHVVLASVLSSLPFSVYLCGSRCPLWLHSLFRTAPT
jgi:hypothetical protein